MLGHKKHRSYGIQVAARLSTYLLSLFCKKEGELSEAVMMLLTQHMLDFSIKLTFCSKLSQTRTSDVAIIVYSIDGFSLNLFTA